MLSLQVGDTLTSEQLEYIIKSMKFYEKELGRARIRAKKRYVPHPRPKQEKVKVEGRGRGRPKKLPVEVEVKQEIPSGKIILE
jgi:hypothetical protein